MNVAIWSVDPVPYDHNATSAQRSYLKSELSAREFNIDGLNYTHRTCWCCLYTSQRWITANCVVMQLKLYVCVRIYVRVCMYFLQVIAKRISRQSHGIGCAVRNAGCRLLARAHIHVFSIHASSPPDSFDSPWAEIGFPQQHICNHALQCYWTINICTNYTFK